MGLFNNLMSAIFSHASNASTTGGTSGGTASPSPASAPGTSGTPTPAMPSATASGQPSAATAPTMPAPSVDLSAVLDKLASKNAEKLDWKHSIVDLMKLVGMDSSLSARKELAQDLHYSGDTNDSATMNVWLHQEVMQQLAANGAKVPEDLLKK